MPRVAQAQTEQVFYYHLDAIGSVRAITDANNQVVERHDYLPFGEAPPGEPAGQDPRRVAGKERDSDTGLDYFGGRFYGSGTGRFTTVDPVLNIENALVNPQFWNRYAYVANNPLRFTDPDGRDPQLLTGGIGAVVFAGWNAYVNVQRGQPWYQNIGLEASKGFLFGATLGLATPALMAADVGLKITSGSVAGGSAIAKAIGSADPAIQFEGETASFLESRGLLKAFDVNIGGRQIDAIAGETRNFVVEMTTGKGSGKIAQAAAQARDTGLDVIIYGKNLSLGFVKEAIRQGYRVARTPEELEQFLRDP